LVVLFLGLGPLLGLGAGLAWLGRTIYLEPRRRLLIGAAIAGAAISVVVTWVIALIAGQPFGTFVAIEVAIFIAEAGCMAWIVVTQATKRRQLVLGTIAIAVGLVLIAPGLLVQAQPYISFGLATTRCGHQPVIANSSSFGYFSGENTYEMPGDDGYGPSLSTQHYYCTAADAELAGYRREGT
jgi:hypothetical protein